MIMVLSLLCYLVNVSHKMSFALPSFPFTFLNASAYASEGLINDFQYFSWIQPRTLHVYILLRSSSQSSWLDDEWCERYPVITLRLSSTRAVLTSKKYYIPISFHHPKLLTRCKAAHHD